MTHDGTDTGGKNIPIYIDKRTPEEKQQEWEEFQDAWDAYLEKLAHV